MRLFRFILIAVAGVVLALVAYPALGFPQAQAQGNREGGSGYHTRVRRTYDFPEKGWHKGPYLAINLGMTRMCGDTNPATSFRFGNCVDVAAGLTLGWDIADWIGPMLQINYATATAWIGNGGAATGPYPEGTFPTENARQHAVDVSLFVKATLPYFIHARWQWNNFKINPYAKLGATGYGMFVHAPTKANNAAAFGAGPAFGAGVEVYVWEGLFFAFDMTENLIFQKPFYKTIAGTVTQVTGGGFRPQTEFMFLFGWHF